MTRQKQQQQQQQVASSKSLIELSKRKMSHTSQRSRTKRRRLAVAGLPLVALALLLSSTLAAETAVVRPTIFSDLNSPPDSSQANQQQPAQNSQVAAGLGGSQQQQPAAPLSPASSLMQHHSGDSTTTAQPASTKINPMRSRFCSSSSGLRLDAPMGMQSLAIDDLALSASSYSNEQVAPHLARLNLDIGGGAWCPMKAISGANFGKEWIQAKLNRSYVVNAIETQGRFGGKEFVPSYQVEYSRNGGLSWHKWKDLKGSSLLRANENVNTAVRNELMPPIVGANVIRIIPYSSQLRTICLRFELHGCQYDEGAPIAYSMNDGVLDQRWGHLNDYTYDGLKTLSHQPHHLSGGLGQLVDGVRGLDNFSHNSGFEWVGWKSMNGDVVIEFTFKTLRNFTGALFHSNNLFSSGVEVFQGVDVQYGIDVAQSGAALRDALVEQRRRDSLLRHGRRLSARELMLEQANNFGLESHSGLGGNQQQQQQQTLWSSELQSIEYEPDKRLETARPVTVHLKHRLANKLRFSLKFASKWVLISEVEFLSHPVEMMSLATLSDRDTPTLLSSLAPAKTYDEYVAILREHQLRRIATNAYFDSMSNLNMSTSTSLPALSGGGGGNDNTNNDQPDISTLVTTPVIPAQIQAQPQPPAPVWNWPPPQLPTQNIYNPNNNNNADLPSTNPLLNQFQMQGQPPSIMLGPANNAIDASSFPMPDSFQQPNEKLAPRQQQQQQTIGLPTMISFGLVAILILLAILFGISSYRLRHHPKLGLPRHLCNPSASGKSLGSSAGSAGGLLHSVFAASGSGSPQSQMINHQSIVDHQYNSLFATSGRLANERQAANTMRRLATLAAGKSSSRSSSGGSDGGNCQNQLLVSLKDSNNGANASKGVNTQLIVGLNQINPLAQQQIYNNSNMNCSNQTYATYHSTSVASSSTDYAIPDAGQVGAVGQPFLANSQQQQQQQGHFKHPAFGYQTDAAMRASYRDPQGRLVQPLMFATTTHQPIARPQNGIVSQQNEHNYELISQDHQQADQPAMFNGGHHQRTLSNQLANCHQSQPFSSMTLNQAQRAQGQAVAARRTQLNVNSSNFGNNQQEAHCSPGTSSDHSAQTTTTSVNSSSGANTSSGLDMGHYYYSSTEAGRNMMAGK